MKKSVVIQQTKKTKRARHCLFDERGIIDACLLVIDCSLRVCCNDFVTHKHTHAHTQCTHTHIHKHTHTHTHTHDILVFFDSERPGLELETVAQGTQQQDVCGHRPGLESAGGELCNANLGPE